MHGDEHRSCVDCRHCSWPPEATGTPSMIEVTAACSHPNQAEGRSMVTGEAGAACITTRLFGGCGEPGLWWEPRTGEVGA